MRKVFCSLAIVVCCCFLVSGCGYHLTSETQTPSLVAGKTVAIPMWRNKSYRMNLEALVTGSVINEFAMRGGGKVVAEEAADLVLSGAIENYLTTAVSYTSADLIREYRITLTIEAQLTERRSQKVLWKGKLSADQDYPALIDPNVANRIALQQNSEDAALREISRKLAQQLFQKMSENF